MPEKLGVFSTICQVGLLTRSKPHSVGGQSICIYVYNMYVYIYVDLYVCIYISTSIFKYIDIYIYTKYVYMDYTESQETVVVNKINVF